jgi:hypothetical protein
MKTIALCFNLPEFKSNINHPSDAWKKPGYGKKYPGAGWMRHLVDLAGNRACVMTGSERMQHSNLRIKDTVLVQEETNICGTMLQDIGADRRVLMCLESPLFASHFYDQVDELKPSWKNTLLFDGGTEHVYFPSFDDEDIRDPVPWNERKFLCMVTSNKHYSAFLKTDSPSFVKAMETQLHDYRYQASHHFIQSPGFDLYGRGWTSYGTEIEDKLSTIRNYKFALCFENGSYPGYVTEKIIDCLVAGVIPIYMGAPDIVDYIPPELFIDARQFKSFHDMDDYVRTNGHRKMASHEWLRSSEGNRYSNRAFAKRILEMCE